MGLNGWIDMGKSTHSSGNGAGSNLITRCLQTAVMLLEAFLSFLGLGVQPPTPSWGLLIKDGADRMREAPWMLIYPGIMFALALFSFNFVGDGLRDALDPKTSRD